jgi:transcriptional antiterminator NusG
VDLAKADKKHLREIIKQMRRLMKKVKGVGLSANQVGLDQKFFIAEVKNKFYTVFNPQITKLSDEKELLEEGCLSVPEIFGKVNRCQKIVLEGQDINGKKIKIKAGKRVEVEEKIYPGYVLVDMIVTDDSWYVVRNTPRVTGFVGAGVNPVPLKSEEMEYLFKKMDTGIVKHNIDIAINETVLIIDGPFKDLEGKVNSVDQERGKIKVLVSMFGRETPIELDFLQVAKV